MRLILLALAGALATTGCGNGPREQWAAENTYLFRDDSHADLQRLFVLQGDRAFVQVAVFPGYSSRKWYRWDKAPEAVLQQARAWAVRPGDVSPPFKPGSVHFIRTTLVPDKAREGARAWYRNDNWDIQTWMRSLRRDLVVEQHRTHQLPDWVREDERITQLLGLAQAPH